MQNCRIRRWWMADFIIVFMARNTLSKDKLHSQGRTKGLVRVMKKKFSTVELMIAVTVPTALAAIVVSATMSIDFRTPNSIFEFLEY